MALTDVKCRGAKPSKTRIKLSDGGGLQFWVQPNGSRLWQLVYQYRGKQAQMALGPYPSNARCTCFKFPSVLRLIRQAPAPAWQRPCGRHSDLPLGARSERCTGPGRRPPPRAVPGSAGAIRGSP
jgi:hypothetical protein